LELALGVLDRIPGAHATAASICFASGDYERGASLRVEPSDHTRPEDFALELLGASLLRKYPGLPGSADRANVAIEKWIACEEQCRLTNERIRDFRIGQIRSDLHDSFRIARKKIQRLLGPFRWSKVAKFFGFGPGSTTRLSYSKRHLPFKYGLEPETTFDNLASAAAVIGLSPVWCLATGGRITDGILPCFRIKEESKVTTVPKDAFVDRVIAIEPDMNMFIQKGFGGYIRNRLKLVKVDLDDQSLNQLLAQQGSRGSLATIDLSSASDTVSWELVKELLDPEWYEALLSCRTHNARLPSGEVITLQKFSSMGNGFTFELESLIFWALCSSVCKYPIGREGLHVSVYGDDIIVSVEDFPAVVDILGFSGFTTNPRKTFSTGPYRESCGKHYFHGHDVTPITITKEITHVSQLLLLCNNLVRFACRQGQFLYRDSAVYDAYRFAVGHLPRNFSRPRLPDGYGDGALIGSFAECLPSRCRRGWDGWRVAGVLLPKQVYRRSTGVHTLAACLSRLEAANPHTFDRGLFDRIFGYGRASSTGGTASSSSSQGYSLGDVSVQFRGPAKFIREALREPDAKLVRSVVAMNTSLPCAPVGARGVGSAELPHKMRCKVGKVFIKQWCDIGPWL